MVVYLICYGASYLLSLKTHFYMSGAALIAAALYLYWRDFRNTGNLIHLRGLFSLSWVGGQGLSCLKLSELSRPWTNETWLCFALAFLGFWVTFEVLGRMKSELRAASYKRRFYLGPQNQIFHAVISITAVSAAAFLFEAWALGYVPLFTIGVPHAYSEFHITGVHYLTVSCVIVPALSMLYLRIEQEKRGRDTDKFRVRLVLALLFVSVMIPILCVSRFQLILALLLLFFTYVAYTREVPLPIVILLLTLAILGYLLLTVARSHSVEYLNEIFEMKNSRMPIFITQPYMYIANNYDNFDCMVRELPSHSLGMRSLFPLWALSGLKFLFPSLVNYPIIVNKKELTTLTLFYDAYYDFGIVGVLVFSCLLGVVAYYLVSRLERMRNPVGYLFYAQMAVYLALAFFTTWFSNSATWFYLVVTGIIFFYCSWKN